ncbi:hypothetical protein [sulfur-oxidizing endosymbiont of Gigantopelta aegis]|uniref:hypothetical protein n=1 Tax=sulfur-oxidizing endosymbiont of Gigantopelta aegis TaxID=2794934 RepID=UPI0018DB1B44|nr:hypothetical protein [sulfur-oxidizing endosymbiont of Gigantopelta aegis]
MISTLIKDLKSQLAQIEESLPSRLGEKRPAYTSLEIPLESTLALPEALLPPVINDCIFLSQPDSGQSLLGLGSFITIEAKGEQRFSTLKTRFSQLRAQWHSHTKQAELPQEATNFSPFAFLSFAFDANDPMTAHWHGNVAILNRTHNLK